MENELVVKEYLGNVIEFKVINGHVYANATSMCKSFDKKTGHWLENKATKEMIDHVSSEVGIPISQLIISKKGNSKDFEQGTWIHEELILELANWLNVSFRRWCQKQIMELLREGHVEIKKEYKKIEDSTPLELLERNSKALNGILKDLNIPKEIIVSTALSETENMTGYEFQKVKKLLNKQDNEDYHTGSYITKKFNIKRNRTNETFILLGLQIKGSSSMQPYVLTELGKKYGVERIYTNKNYQGYEIKWKDCVIEYIKENIKDIPIEWIRK